MDAEEREAFKEIREAVDRGYGRLEVKVDQAREDFSAHVVEAAKDTQRLSDSLAAAHRRMDMHETWHRDHKDSTLKKMALWLTALFGAIGAAIGIGKFFKGGGP